MALEKVSYRELKEKLGSLKALATEDKSSVVAAINELFTSAGNGKVAIAAAITGKGVPTAASDSFAAMAQNIGDIETGTTASGTKNISANGTYDVAQYASANVNVSSQAPTLITKLITANGTYNATSDNADGYSSVTVNVPSGSQNSRSFTKTLESDADFGYIAFNPDGDPEIAAHRNDSTFMVAFMRVTPYLNSNNTSLSIATNHEIVTDKGYTGLYGRYGSSGALSGVALSKSVTDTQDNTPGAINVSSSGVISMFSSSTYTLRAGTYVAVCGW